MYKALVVDDDNDSRDLLDFYLRSKGFDVVTAPDGLSALRRMDAFLPDIVFTDIVMDVMDGWTFLERKWSDARVARIPVVVVSASVLEREPRPYPYEFVTKPVDLQRLWSTVSGLLTKS